jgi:hypothetical protein
MGQRELAKVMDISGRAALAVEERFGAPREGEAVGAG